MKQRAIPWLVLLVLVPGHSSAQSVLELPRPSQAASVMQRIGITDITIHYSRPLVRGRQIWGGVVPYGQVWRGGANENTTLSTTDDISVEGKPLKAGTYGVHMIPGEQEWTVAFSRNSTSWGSFTYDQTEDALRVTVKPTSAEFREALSYEFDEINSDSAVLVLRWERLAVPIHITVNTQQVVAQSLKNQLRAWSRWIWQGWDEAASYLLENHGDLEDALKYSDHSIAIERRFDNLLTKSQILSALERTAEAQATRQEAFSVASAQQLHAYGRQLQAEGRQAEAFEIFKINIQQHPDDWMAQTEIARMSCARGDFENAAKQMRFALAHAPDFVRPNLENLARRLEQREDINK